MLTSVTSVLRPELEPRELTGQLHWSRFSTGKRPVVVIVLFRRPRLSVLFVQPKNDPTGASWILPQGGIEEGESLFGAARRELREEVPSFRRLNPRAEPKVEWDKVVYLGSACNPAARSGRPSDVHCVLLTTQCPNIRPNSAECRGVQWSYDPEHAEALLEPTRVGNPQKWQIITAAIAAGYAVLTTT